MKYSARLPSMLRPRSHPSRGAWIEMPLALPLDACRRSHPSRGAWIEILVNYGRDCHNNVAPLAGCVD